MRLAELHQFGIGADQFGLIAGTIEPEGADAGIAQHPIEPALSFDHGHPLAPGGLDIGADEHELAAHAIIITKGTGVYLIPAFPAGVTAHTPGEAGGPGTQQATHRLPALLDVLRKTIVIHGTAKHRVQGKPAAAEKA